MRRLFPILLLLGACGDAPSGDSTGRAAARDPSPPPRPPRRVEADRVVVDQILISFKGAKRFGHRVERTRAEAERLAKSLLDRIEAGVSFLDLKRAYSDYRLEESNELGGPVTACNEGVRTSRWEVPYANLYPGWRDKAFTLRPRQVAFVEYDKHAYPEGYAILFRIR